MNLLIIDDEVSLTKLLQLSLQSSQVMVATAGTATAGLEAVQKDLYDVVVCDIGLPDRSGLELLRELKAQSTELPVIMITAHGSIDSALEAMKSGAYDYIQKPFDPAELKLVVDRALREKNLQDENRRLRSEVHTRYDFSNIVGNSTALKDVFARIRKAADTKSTILIQGESGTGKELLAKAVHFNSSRKSGPFVVVDCTAIPNNLLESELFGHIKGAFTGADRAKKGLCEEAHGGTLFLDEIGELPLELQAKLLRLLQESTIRRVGDTKPVDVDVRIVAATNRDLEKESKEGRFRQDLFYRLNVVPVQAPALRDRRDDIPLLAHFFLKKYAKEYGRDVRGFSPEVLGILSQFEWPGNVRQLENVVEQMVVMAEETQLTSAQLPPAFHSAGTAAALPVDDWDLKRALQSVQAYTEEALIRKALAHTRNNKTRAAELLGISRRALIYKAQEYKISGVDTDGNDEADLASS